MYKSFFKITLFLPLFLCGCEEPKTSFETMAHNEEFLYKITTGPDNRIMGYDYFINSDKQKSAVYDYSDSHVILTIMDKNGKLLSNHYYETGESSFAQSSTDSIFDEDVLTVRTSKYEYDENHYLAKKTFTYSEYKNGKVDSTGNGFIAYTINSGNTTEIRYYHESNGNVVYDCTDLLRYNEFENLVDINNLTGSITGTCNNNLLKSKSYETDCIKNDIYEPASSTFNYELDNNGRVIHKYELYTPVYSKNSSVAVYRVEANYYYSYSSSR